MSVAITMPPQIGQSGYCGNFNGVVDDDFEAVSPSFHRPIGSDLGPVVSLEVLFNTSTWGEWSPGLDDNQTWLDPGSVLSSCNQYLQAIAAERCGRITDARMKQDCVIDVCATGLQQLADGILAAEILEMKVNARGIPVFMGHGECLDSVGRSYVGFSTQLGTVKDCTDILRSLALIPGIMGAQLQEGGLCQVLVTDQANPTEIQIKSGWGAKINELSQGRGLISSVTADSQWQCWQLI